MWKIAALCLAVACLLFPTAGFAEAGPGPEFLVLLSNDDGYYAPGLRALAEAMAPLGQVVIAAPVDNQSGTGHGTTARQFLQVRSVQIAPGLPGHAIAARPATCVRLALEALVPRRPDLVISGINRGANLGLVTFYSGTVGAAREAAMAGIPAIAVSLQGDAAEDYAAAAAFVRQLVEALRAQHRLRPRLFLNVNVPAGDRQGVRLTRQSVIRTAQVFQPYTPRPEYQYFWADYGPLVDDDESTDVWAVQHGFISVTPLQIDQTRAADLDWLRQLDLETAPAAVSGR